MLGTDPLVDGVTGLVRKVVAAMDSEEEEDVGKGDEGDDKEATSPREELELQPRLSYISDLDRKISKKGNGGAADGGVYKAGGKALDATEAKAMLPPFVVNIARYVNPF